MFETVIITLLSIALLFMSWLNLKLRKKLTEYEFEIFMKNLNDEMISRTKEDHTIIERILQ